MFGRRLLNKPLALNPRDAETLLQEYARAPTPEDQLAMFELSFLEREPYDVTHGIAIIDISGVLVHGRGSWWAGETGYDTIASAYAEAMSDTSIDAVALLINSPGGEVAGMFDMMDLIHTTRGLKPVWSILDENAFSAAYAIASAADYVTVPRTGGTGSIGVIAMHTDITGALEQVGIKISTIQFGARKSDYYPTTPLSNEARKRLQAEVDETGEMFVEAVARNRRMSAESVRRTEAGTFQGQAGVSAGLADAVLSRDDALLSLISEVKK